MRIQRPITWLHRPAGKRTRADLIVKELPDGLAVFDWKFDRVHYLNNTAALIFSLCTGIRSLVVLLPTDL